MLGSQMVVAGVRGNKYRFLTALSHIYVDCLCWLLACVADLGVL